VLRLAAADAVTPVANTSDHASYVSRARAHGRRTLRPRAAPATQHL